MPFLSPVGTAAPSVSETGSVALSGPATETAPIIQRETEIAIEKEGDCLLRRL